MNGPYPIPSSQYYVGLQYGYVIIPADVDRTSFIEQCYRWERISILSERGGGVFHECYISRESIKDVEFPADSTHFGSCVMFLTDIHSGHPMIFGVLSKEDESQLLREGYFKLTKTYQGSSVILSGDAKKGVMNLSVDGGELTQLNITVSNGTKDAQINVRCQGNINLEMDGLFKINKGTQAMVKGTELKTQLDKNNNLLQALLDIINGAPILEPGSGSASALQAALKAAITAKQLGSFNAIKSDESFLD